MLGLVLATLFIPNLTGDAPTRFDVRGFVLSALGLAGFMSGSTALGLGLLPKSLTLTLLLGGAALLAAYVVHSRRAANPILDLSLFRIPTFAMSLIGALLFRLGVGATPFLLPLLLQIGFGLSPFKSGSITFASAVGAIAMKFAAPADPAPPRLPPRADLERADRRRLRCASRHLHADDTDCGDPRAAADRRLLPLAAVHQHQCAELSPTCRRSG